MKLTVLLPAGIEAKAIREVTERHPCPLHSRIGLCRPQVGPVHALEPNSRAGGGRLGFGSGGQLPCHYRQPQRAANPDPWDVLRDDARNTR